MLQAYCLRRKDCIDSEAALAYSGTLTGLRKLSSTDIVEDIFRGPED